MKEEQVQFYKKEAGRLNEEKKDLDTKLKEKTKEVGELGSKQRLLEEESQELGKVKE